MTRDVRLGQGQTLLCAVVTGANTQYIGRCLFILLDVSSLEVTHRAESSRKGQGGGIEQTGMPLAARN